MLVGSNVRRVAVVGGMRIPFARGHGAYARVGKTFCRTCGQEVVRETAELVARRLSAFLEGTRMLIGFSLPVVAMASSPSDVQGYGSENAARVGARTMPA